MTQLPASIEQYLLESGFSGTEIFILKHLLAGGSMTLRELAAKTGKSTGVLDSASKKLLKKGILGREVINETPKLTLFSLDAVVAWVHEDAEHKRRAMDRREKDLQSFVDSLSVEVNRADIQHYEGLEGLESAYTKLLQECHGHMIHFLPVRHTEVEDPLRDFLVSYCRLRRRQSVITRVIAQDTPLGRRYHSRDAFEYRQTLLVPESVYAFATEKVVAGDWVATINHEENKAFLIRSKELAHTEKAMFEAIWRQEVVKLKEKVGQATMAGVPKEVEIGTRMTLAVRAFLLSKRSIAVFAFCGILAGVLTFALYKNNEALNLKRVEEKVLSIAATGALQFDAKDLDQLHTQKDIVKPQYAKVIRQLNAIRQQNQGIQYIYIMRSTKELGIWEFVADADSLDPHEKKDLNKDGKIDEADHLSPPGERYNPMNSMKENSLVLIQPTILSALADQWGNLIAGWAPIKDSTGKTVAVLGVDKFATDVDSLTKKTFKPFLYFVGLFLLFVFIRLTAFNRSLLKEIFSLGKTKAFLTAACVLVIVFIVFSM